jgi:beta-lactam-binding protein with PASTA domain
MVRVPHRADIALDSTVRLLYHLGLRITVPAWTVSSRDGLYAEIESPAPGTSVRRGSVVRFEVLPVLGSPGWTPGRWVVPDVLGTTLEGATQRIQDAGLGWLVRAGPLPPTTTEDLFASYCVTSQTPGPGVEIVIEPSGPEGLTTVILAARAC